MCLGLTIGSPLSQRKYFHFSVILNTLFLILMAEIAEHSQDFPFILNSACNMRWSEGKRLLGRPGRSRNSLSGGVATTAATSNVSLLNQI